jgi:hypothetical protein
MIVKVSNWLISQAKLYPPNSPALVIIADGTQRNQNVTLLYAYIDSSTGNIIITWVFTQRTNYQISSTPLNILLRLDNGSNLVVYKDYLTIPSSYTWGQVLLVESISIYGAQ